MSSPPASVETPGSPGRRFLIAAGTAHYQFLPEEDQLPSVDEAVRLIVELFTGKLGYERVLPGLGNSPTVEELHKGLSNWLTADERRASDLVVIYYSGHGESCEDDHFLLAADSRRDEKTGSVQPETALASGDLARVLARTRVQQVLLILDTCHAGHGGEDFTAKAGRVIRTHRRDYRLPSGVYAIAAAGPKEEAAPCVFTREFVRVVGEVPLSVAGAGPAFLPLVAVVDEINRRFRGKIPQEVNIDSVRVVGVLPFLPNLRHVRVPLGMVPGELSAHWGPRSRSVEAEAQPGWYFTGRVAALSELVAWLAAPAAAGGGARVVTGKAGSGKSAVLSRLATLSLPDYRQRVPLEGVPPQTVPPVNLIDVAVFARQKSLAECVAAIACAAGVEADRPETLVDALAEWGGGRDDGRVRVILLDALDESVEPFEVARRLLRPLAQARAVRLLVAVRREAFPGPHPDLLGALGPAFDVLDLDAPRYALVEDFAAYVTRRLLAETDPDHTTPYRGRSDLARQVSEAVGRRAYPVFLVARLICETLVEADEPVDVTRPGWDATFPATVHDAFEEYLDRFGSDKPRVVDLLRPLAYAEGAGLPFEDLWASLASVLARREYTDDDVEWLLGRAGAFVVEAVEDGRSVYRLYHQALAEHLRSPRQAVAHQGQIVRTLTGLTPDRPDGGGKDWPRANPYVRQHLAAHAAQAGRLGELMVDPLYLVAAEPDRLLRALIAHNLDLPREPVHVYQGAIHHLQTPSFAERAAYLEMVARQSGLNAFADQIGRLPLRRPFSVPWANWQFAATHRVIFGHEGPVESMVLGELEGRPVIVSGGDDGTVRVWDLASGRPLGEPLRPHGVNSSDARVWTVAVGQLDGRAVIVSRSYDWMVRVWDLASGRPVGEPWHRDFFLTKCQLDGRAVAVSSEDGDGTVRLWDLASARPVGKPIRGHDNRVWAVGQLDGRAVIVSSRHGDGTVRLWDLDNGCLLGELRGDASWAYEPPGSVAVGKLGGRPVVVFGDRHGTLRVWDLVESRLQGEPLRGHENIRINPGKGGVTSVALVELEGRPIIVSGGCDGAVRLWDWELIGGHRSSEPPRGHEGRVTSIAVGELEDRPAVASGGENGTVRLWDLENGCLLGELRGDAHTSYNGVISWASILSVAVGKLRGRPVIVWGADDGTVRVWEWGPDGGRLLGEPLRVSPAEIMAVGELDGRLLITTKTGNDSYIHVWEWGPDGGRSLGEPLSGGYLIHCLSLGKLEGRPVIVSGYGYTFSRMWFTNVNGGVCVLDPIEGHHLGGTLISHESEVSSVAVGELGGRPAIVSGADDGTVRVWEWGPGGSRSLGEPLRGHEGRVTSVAAGELEGHPVIVSGGRDGTVRVWAASGQQEAMISVGAHVSNVSLASGMRIVVGTSKGLMVLKIAPESSFPFNAAERHPTA